MSNSALVLLANGTVPTSNSWTISGLSSYSGYKDIIIELDAYMSTGTTGALLFQLNGDTGNNYSFTTLSEKQDPATRIECYPLKAAASRMIYYSITLPDFQTSTGKYKNVYVRQGSMDGTIVNLISGYRKNNANVTSVNFNGADLGGHKYRLYGRL